MEGDGEGWMSVRAASGAVLRHVGCDVVLVSDSGVSVDW